MLASAFYEVTLNDVPVSVVLYFLKGLAAGPFTTEPSVEKLEP